MSLVLAVREPRHRKYS